MKKPKKRKKLLYRFLDSVLPDRGFLQALSLMKNRRLINFKDPKTFNEWLQVQKLYGYDPLHTTLADKCAVRKYVAERVGEEYIVPLLAHFSNVDDIDFEALPDSFVLKSSHGSGHVMIIKDKSRIDYEQTREVLRYWLGMDFYRFSKERQYKDIPRQIVVENIIPTDDGQPPVDYKFHCFNGNVKSIGVDFDRFTDHKRNFYDPQWNLQPFMYCVFSRLGKPKYPYGRELARPENLDKMIEVAEKLSQGLKYVRVDLYNVNGKVLFGEMTMHHGSGWEKFSPKQWDYTWREWLE